MLLEDRDVGSMTHLWLLAPLPGMFMVSEIRHDSTALERTSGAAPMPRSEAGECRGAVAARWLPPSTRPTTGAGTGASQSENEQGEAVGDPISLLSSDQIQQGGRG